MEQHGRHAPSCCNDSMGPALLSMQDGSRPVAFCLPTPSTPATATAVYYP